MVTAVLIPKNSAKDRVMPYWSFDGEPIIINNPEYSADLASDTVTVFDKKRLEKLLLNIHNNGAATFDYEIIGSTLDSDVPPAIDEFWYRFPTGNGSVLEKQTDAKFISDPWMWIIIRVKESIAGTPTNGSISATALPRV